MTKFPDSIKLSLFNGQQTAYLEAPQRINILCGKNNSGKSTLLRALSSDKTRQQGIRLSVNDIGQIVAHIANLLYSEENIIEAYPNLEKDIAKKFSAKWNTEQIWYEDDAELLYNTIVKIIDLPIESDLFLHYTRSNLAEAFKRAFSLWNALLVPEKRRLEYYEAVDNTHKDASGYGIITDLFEMQGQAPDDERRKHYNKIKQAFQKITNGRDFELRYNKKDKRAELIIDSINGAWMTSNESGQGLVDLIIILFHTTSDSTNILLIEEPENHLHPEIQRNLLRYLYYLYKETTQTFFITTHSNIFLDTTLVDTIYLVKNDGNITTELVTSKAVALNELGYSVSDNLTADIIIFTEGITDQRVLEEFLSKMGLLEAYNIKFWGLCGNYMKHRDLDVISDYNRIALIDRDDKNPETHAIRENFLQTCEELGIPVHRLQYNCIENYFSVQAIKAVYGNKLEITLDQLRSTEKMNDLVPGFAKSKIWEVAKMMTIADIEGTDLYTKFLLKVKDILEAQPKGH